MCRALVMKRQGDGVEHVLPEDFFPSPILRQIHAQRWKAVRDGDGDFGLLGLAVAGDGGPNPLRRVHRELGVLASGEIPRRTRQLVELVKPRHWVSVRLLHDHDIGLVRPHPRSQVLSGGGEPLVLRRSAEPEYSARHESTAAQDGVTEIAKTGIEGEDGVRSFAHGV